MTRPTGEDAMSSEHVEVLRHMKETIKAIMPSEVAALDAAIASLSAPQPPAEAQAQGGGEVVAWEWEYVGNDPYPRGKTVARALHEMDPQNPPYPETWRPTRPLVYGDAAPPSAPVGVEDESVRVGNLPTMNQDGYPGIGEWWVQLWRGDEIIARVYGDGPDEVRSQAQDIADALNQQPAAVDGPDAQAAVIQTLRAEVERLNRILGRIVEGDGDSNLTIRAGTDAFAAAREYLLRDQEEGK